MDTKDDTDRKALLTAAIDALARAREACAAAGVPVIAGGSVRSLDDLAALLKTRAEEALALLVAADQPIAFGGEVRICDGRHGRTETLVKIGREYIHTTRDRYQIDGGHGSHGKSIHPHDLARIKRWLCKPAKAVRP